MIDTAIILAAGKGSRLKEVTAHRSKALAPIAGKPIIERVIDSLRDAGIIHFIIVGSPKDNELRAFTESIPSATFTIQERALGSADALKGCEPITPETFLVCACDSIVPTNDIRNLIASHEQGTGATLSIIEVAPEISLSARSVVTMKGDVVADIIEKPSQSERTSNLSSLPLYILTRAVFTEIEALQPSERGEYELPAALRSMIKKGTLMKGVRATNRDDLTDQNDLLELNLRFLAEFSPHRRIHPNVTIPTSATIIEPVIIEDGVTIGENTVIGPFVYLERTSTVQSGSSINYSIALRGAVVSGEKARTVVT